MTTEFLKCHNCGKDLTIGLVQNPWDAEIALNEHGHPQVFFFCENCDNEEPDLEFDEHEEVD